MGIISVWYVILSLRPGMVPLQDGNHQLQSYRRIITLMLAFGSLLSMTFISEKIGIRLNWEKAAYILAFAYIMVIGNLYPTLRHQFLIGIKNPWTLSDDTIWRKTHHFAGKFYFFVGLAGIIYGILFDTNPVPYMPLILVVFVFSLKYVPMAYSYFLYRQIKKI